MGHTSANNGFITMLKCEGWLTWAYTKAKEDNDKFKMIIYLLAIRVIKSKKITRHRAACIQVILRRIMRGSINNDIEFFIKEWNTYRNTCIQQ